MASANVRNIYRAKGYLCFNPTDLTIAFPHGGTALGIVRDMVFHFGAKTAVSTAEEWGGVVTKAYYTGQAPFMACVLREFDTDALTKIFPNTQTGSVSQGQTINYIPGGSGNRPGYDLSNKQIKLVFSPVAADRHDFIVMYYAIPTIDEDAQLVLSMREEIGMAVVFWCGVDSSGRTYRIGKRADLNPLLA